MKVICPNCLSAYSVKDESVPPAGANVKCPRCAATIALAREPVSPLSDLDHDYSQTMVLFVPMPAQQEKQAEEVLSKLTGAEPGLRGIKVTLTEQGAQDREFRLVKPKTVIGRKQTDVVLEDPEVSRRHAAVEIYGDMAVVRDLGSTNGTFLNGLAVKLAILKDGDEIQMGNTRLKVVIG